MKLKEIKNTALIVTFLIVFVLGIAGVSSAESAGSNVLPLVDYGLDVSLAGIFHPYSDNIKKGEIVILVRDKKWLFEVLDFGKQSSPGRGEILHSVRLPSSLRLIGPNKLIDSLIETDVTGKMFVFLGDMYDIDQVMVIKLGRNIPLGKK